MLVSITHTMGFDEPLLVTIGEPGFLSLSELWKASIARYAGWPEVVTTLTRARPGACGSVHETQVLVEPLKKR